MRLIWTAVKGPAKPPSEEMTMITEWMIPCQVGLLQFSSQASSAITVGKGAKKEKASNVAKGRAIATRKPLIL